MALKVNDIIKARNSGYHKILEMNELEDGDIEVVYEQIATVDGRLMKLNYPSTCSIKECRHAVMDIPMLKKRVDTIKDFIIYLQKQLEKNV